MNLTTDHRYRHFCSQIDLLSIQDDIITGECLDETGSFQFRQVMLPKHLVTELPQALHGTTNIYPGISQMLQENRQRYY